MERAFREQQNASTSTAHVEQTQVHITELRSTPPTFRFWQKLEQIEASIEAQHLSTKTIGNRLNQLGKMVHLFITEIPNNPAGALDKKPYPLTDWLASQFKAIEQLTENVDRLHQEHEALQQSIADLQDEVYRGSRESISVDVLRPLIKEMSTTRELLAASHRRNIAWQKIAGVLLLANTAAAGLITAALLGLFNLGS